MYSLLRRVTHASSLTSLLRDASISGWQSDHSLAARTITARLPATHRALTHPHTHTHTGDTADHSL